MGRPPSSSSSNYYHPGGAGGGGRFVGGGGFGSNSSGSTNPIYRFFTIPIPSVPPNVHTAIVERSIGGSCRGRNDNDDSGNRNRNNSKHPWLGQPQQRDGAYRRVQDTRGLLDECQDVQRECYDTVRQLMADRTATLRTEEVHITTTEMERLQSHLTQVESDMRRDFVTARQVRQQQVDNECQALLRQQNMLPSLIQEEDENEERDNQNKNDDVAVDADEGTEASLSQLPPPTKKQKLTNNEDNDNHLNDEKDEVQTHTANDAKGDNGADEMNDTDKDNDDDSSKADPTVAAVDVASQSQTTTQTATTQTTTTKRSNDKQRELDEIKRQVKEHTETKHQLIWLLKQVIKAEQKQKIQAKQQQKQQGGSATSTDGAA